MKKFFTFIHFFAFALAVNAQVTFQKLYGGSDDEGMFELTRIHDGGYILAGQTESFGASQNDIYLIRTDADGILLWSKAYRGSGTEYAIGINETSDNGFILSGATTSFGAGSEDGFLMKTDSAGNLQWSKVYGGPQEDIIFSAVQTSDGGYIAAGHTASFGAGSMDILVLRTDASGDTLWTRLIGGAGWDNATDIIQTSDSNFVLCGRTGSFGSTFMKIFLGKMSNTGDTLWSVQYGGNGQEESQSLQETFDGDYIVAGSTNSFSSTNYNAYLNRFDTGGNLIWSKIYGGQKTEAMYEVVNMADSGFAITGFTESFGPGHRGNDSANVWVVRTDANGDTLWTQSYGGDYMDEVYGLAKADNEGLAILAYSTSFGTDSLDAYLIMTDSLGNSNCNEETGVPFVLLPTTIVDRVSPQINSGVLVAVAPFTTIVPSTFQSILCFAVAINDVEVSTNGVLLFPNPAVNEIRINPDVSGAELRIEHVEIIDVLGQRVLRQPQTANHKSQTIIDVSKLTPGFYLVQVKTKEKMFSQKLLIGR